MNKAWPEGSQSPILRIAEEFRRRFGEKPLLIRSPGRVNLIGEHTDYNQGFVLPAATDKAVYFALSSREDDVILLVAADKKEESGLSIGGISRSPLGWPDYLLGVVDQILKLGLKIRGFNCVFGGDLPIGAGMSSSAAVEAGLAFGLNRLFDLGLEDLALVEISQRAENEFVGVRCGIMDQFINIYGRPGNVLKLDCRSLEYDYFPFESDDLCLVVCDTMVRRGLASSEYNVRRSQCENVVDVLSQCQPGMQSLRDITLDLLAAHRQDVDPLLYRRAAYVIKENARVEAACGDLAKGDFRSFGQRMNESHAGLRDEYEVSCRELDTLVEAASGVAGVYGARMMGAGFGGCTINLVEESSLEEFRKRVIAVYERTFHKTPNIHMIRIEGGTRVIPDFTNS